MTEREKALIAAARPRLNARTMQHLEELAEAAEAMNDVALKIGLRFLLDKEKKLRAALEIAGEA